MQLIKLLVLSLLVLVTGCATEYVSKPPPKEFVQCMDVAKKRHSHLKRMIELQQMHQNDQVKQQLAEYEKEWENLPKNC